MCATKYWMEGWCIVLFVDPSSVPKAIVVDETGMCHDSEPARGCSTPITRPALVRWLAVRFDMDITDCFGRLECGGSS
jgi:hypothetical protein